MNASQALAAFAAGSSLLLWHRLSRRPPEEVYETGPWLIRTRLTGGSPQPSSHAEPFLARLQRRRLHRAVRAYVPPPWNDLLCAPAVRLTGRLASRAVRVESGYELSLNPPRGVARWSLGAQMTMLAFTALAGAVSLGRGSNLPRAPYQPGRPGGTGFTPALQGRLLMANLATPSPRTFQIPSVHANSGVASPSPSSVATTGPTHANLATFASHTNTPAQHSNTASHTNTSTRPFQ